MKGERWAFMAPASLWVLEDPPVAQVFQEHINRDLFAAAERDDVELSTTPPRWAGDIFYPHSGIMRFEGTGR